MLAVYQPESVMNAMDEWNTRQHGNSGLTTRVLDSDISEGEAEKQTIEFLQQWVDEGKSPMCGNSICQDRRFLAREMPELEAFFHYRNLDVSTLKILAQQWAPGVAKSSIRSCSQRAHRSARSSTSLSATSPGASRRSPARPMSW